MPAGETRKGYANMRIHAGAEGATAPETLRQKDRRRDQEGPLWKAGGGA